MSNQGARRLIGLFLSPEDLAAVGGRLNAMRLVYHPRGLRPHIVNWEATAAAMIQSLHLRPRPRRRGRGDAPAAG